ncbi:arylsulfatase [Aerococcaceae bacterium DSM 111020]|nr:arylsulfatase [Aerococcaceae bacterium DSM 111020]
MSKKPNVVLFFVDDLGIGDVSAFNKDAQFQTKNIDRLAEKGMKFTDSHATSALCTPSRYGLLTGRYNWRSRLKSIVAPGDSLPLIEKDRKTIAQLLKDHGYNTAAVGKWHLGLEWTLREDGPDYETYGLDKEYIEEKNPEHIKGRPHFGNTTAEPYIRGLDIDYTKEITFGPNEFGFDYAYVTPASIDQGPFVIVENNKVIDIPTVITGNPQISRIKSDTWRQWEPGVASPESSPYHLPDKMQAKAMEVLDEFIEEEEPFFLYYPNHLVHGPIVPNDKFKGTSGVGIYGDFVLQLDSYVGEVIDRLEEAGEFDNTIFIFTSDNGVSSIAGLEDLREQGHDSSLGYRGHKMHIYEGGHREPTIVSYPEMIEAGTESNHMVSHSDFFATLADLLGTDLDDDMAEDSYSNLPLWRGEDKEIRQDIVSSAGNGAFAIRRDFWKLIMTPGDGMNFAYDRNLDSYKEVFQAAQLYDLRDDVAETTNVIDEHPEVVEELSKALEEYVLTGRSTPGEDQANQPDQPTGDWEQLAWMSNYEEYIEKLNKAYADDKK